MNVYAEKSYLFQMHHTRQFAYNFVFPFVLCIRVVEMCKTFQTSVVDLSERYFSRLRRHNYVTPTSYLELILTFKTLLNIKRNEVNNAKKRYIVGLQKLDFAASQVIPLLKSQYH